MGLAKRDQVRKLRIYERARVREFWLIHPTDRVLTIYRWSNGAYARPDVLELAGTTPVQTLPNVEIAWDALLARLPPIES